MVKSIIGLMVLLAAVPAYGQSRNRSSDYSYFNEWQARNGHPVTASDMTTYHWNGYNTDRRWSDRRWRRYRPEDRQRDCETRVYVDYYGNRTVIRECN